MTTHATVSHRPLTSHPKKQSQDGAIRRVRVFDGQAVLYMGDTVILLIVASAMRDVIPSLSRRCTL